MKVGIPSICAFLACLLLPAAEETGKISPAQAIHLMERVLEERSLEPQLVVQSLRTGQLDGRPVYRIHARGGQEDFQGIVDAGVARLLEIERNGQRFYRWPGPIVVGHRGTVKFAPENTIPAFREAMRRGADLLEMDIRQTRDGVLVVIHDETLDRTTNGTGEVSTHSLKELKELDAGSWFSPDFAGTRIPTLREALAEIRGKALPDIDFKAGDPDKLIRMLQEEQLLGKVTLYCGDWELLAKTQQLTDDLFWRPTVPLGKVGLPLLIQKFNPPIVNVNWEEFSEQLIREIHLAGRKSFVNTMQQDTELILEMALDTAPDYIQSDHLDLLMRLLQKRGFRPDQELIPAGR